MKQYQNMNIYNIKNLKNILLTINFIKYFVCVCDQFSNKNVLIINYCFKTQAYKESYFLGFAFLSMQTIDFIMCVVIICSFQRHIVRRDQRIMVEVAISRGGGRGNNSNNDIGCVAEVVVVIMLEAMVMN